MASTPLLWPAPDTYPLAWTSLSISGKPASGCRIRDSTKTPLTSASSGSSRQPELASQCSMGTFSVPNGDGAGVVAIAAARAQTTSRNPYKRPPKASIAECLAQPISEDPMGLVGVMVDIMSREQFYGPGKDGTLPDMPRILNPRNPGNEDTNEEDIDLDFGLPSLPPSRSRPRSPERHPRRSRSPPERRANENLAHPVPVAAHDVEPKHQPLQPTFSPRIVRTLDHYRSASREQSYGPGTDRSPERYPRRSRSLPLQPTVSPRIVRSPDHYRNAGAGGRLGWPRSISMPGMGQMSMSSNSPPPSRRSSTWPSALASASSYSKYLSDPTRTSMKPEANSRRADQIRSGSGEKPRCLINVDSLELTEFGKADFVPSYAILSHRWGRKDEEVGYHEFKRPTVETHRKAGYRKIVGACLQAFLHGCSYLWVDTCCINQDDKDDVHRNIKSMFSYYQHSSVCLAYLADVDRRFFRDSVWFMRGWTLQELLAPLDVEFFNRKWESIGHRLDRSREISLITGIPEDVVKGETHIHEVDVEEKMSWSAHRETSRPPDQAYCLFGILGVSVEPDYEEDVQMAFSRLCEAWFKKFAEQSGGRRVMVPNMTRLYRSLRYRVRKEAWSYRDRNSTTNTRGHSVG